MFVNLKIFVGYIPSMKYLLFIHMWYKQTKQKQKKLTKKLFELLRFIYLLILLFNYLSFDWYLITLL